MFKFIPGILILQIITVALVLIAPTDLAGWDWIRLAVPVLVAGLLTAIWFGSIAAHRHQDEISRLKEKHAKERETIRVNAERAKTRLVKQAQQKTMQKTRRLNRQTNFKAGLVFAGAAGLGGVLIATQFMSLGLLLLTTAGGGLGGYLLRYRQEKNKRQLPLSDSPPPRLINPKPNKVKQLLTIRSTEKE
jgi:Flp pilus assembly protein TadB